MKQKKTLQNGAVAKNQNLAVAGNSKAKLAKNKKSEKTPVKIVPPKKIEEDEDDSENESEDDSGADLAADVVGEEKDSEDEQEIDEDDEDDDDDDEDDESDEEGTTKDFLDDEAEVEDNDDDDEDENENDDDNSTNSDAAEEDDEAPTEAPIMKKSSEPAVAKKKKQQGKEEESNKNSIDKIKTGSLAKDFPLEQVIVVKNLPKRFKQINIVEVFAKYGTLHTIHPVHGPVGSIAYVAYTTPEAAQKAVAATDNTAKVKGVTIRVSLHKTNTKKQKNDDSKKKNVAENKLKIEESKSRSVYIKYLRPKTTEAQVREHFEGCGNIENVKIFDRKSNSYGFVTFAKEADIIVAKKLHNSVLNNSNIWVLLPSEQSYKEVEKDPKRTISINNTKNLESFPADKLTEIFSKCGEIEGMSILCKKHVLAFVTFKDEKSAKKALKLNGTSARDLDLEIEEYKVKAPKSKTTIFVQNVKPGVTEEEIRELFSEAGDIENVFIQNGFSIIRFKEADGFCKSFLLNESLLQGQIIFIEPYSEKKQFILKSNQKFHHGKKRPHPHPHNQGVYNKKFKPN